MSLKNKLLGLVLAVVATAIPAKSQTRILVGTTGGSSFGNLYVGVTAGLEVPFIKHFEFDLKDTFSPIEEHVALGSGYANQAYAGGIVWLTKSVGVDGGASYSTYHVSNTTVTAKGTPYASGGVAIRKSLQGMPVRFTMNYVREMDHGISANGTETDNLQAGEFKLDMRIKCGGPFCYRVQFDFMVGRVLTQGNPICDGTYGLTGGPNNGPCPRTAATSGSFTGALLLEFPRHRATENDAF